jgi:hypothetical protein
MPKSSTQRSEHIIRAIFVAIAPSGHRIRVRRWNPCHSPETLGRATCESCIRSGESRAGVSPTSQAWTEPRTRRPALLGIEICADGFKGAHVSTSHIAIEPIACLTEPPQGSDFGRVASSICISFQSPQIADLSCRALGSLFRPYTDNIVNSIRHLGLGHNIIQHTIMFLTTYHWHKILKVFDGRV